MISESNDSFPTKMLEDILDQACIDAGMKPEELEQAKVIARIEEQLVAEGRSIKEIYKEWATKTPPQIIAEYADSIKPSGTELQQNAPVETDWLPVIFLGLTTEHPPIAHFQVNTSRDQLIPQQTLDIAVEDAVLQRFSSMRSRQPVSIRMRVHLADTEPSITLMDVKLEKLNQQTFDSKRHR